MFFSLVRVPCAVYLFVTLADRLWAEMSMTQCSDTKHALTSDQGTLYGKKSDGSASSPRRGAHW